MDHLGMSTKSHDHARIFILQLKLHHLSIQMSHTLCYPLHNHPALKGVGMVQFSCMTVGVIHLDRLWCGYIASCVDPTNPSRQWVTVATIYDWGCESCSVTKPVLPAAKISWIKLPLLFGSLTSRPAVAHVQLAFHEKLRNKGVQKCYLQKQRQM